MNISFRQVKVFLAVVQERNFSRAGTVVGLSQPAVSRAVAELEDQLGVRLLDRSTREVALTEAGQMLAQRLPHWMDELDNILLELRTWAGSRRGKVRVASSPTISAALMPRCLAECALQEPGLEVLLLDRIQEDVLDSILTGEVDFGVIVEPRPSLLRDMHCETILTDPFVAVLPQVHKLAAGAPQELPWSALDGHALVLLDYASGSRPLIDQALLHHGLRCPVSQQVGHATTGFEMVQAGLGLSVMPGLAVPERGLAGLVARRLTPGVERRIMLAHRRNRVLSPLAQCLWALIREGARQTMARRERLWR